MLKIAINGASGRMGQEILKIIQEDADKYQLSFAKVRVGCGGNAIAYVHQLPETTNANVVIDFSVPSASLETLQWCVKHKIAIVIGTTGFTENDLREIKEAALNIPVLLSYNTNLSVNVLFKVSQLVAKALKDSEVEIIEYHHRFKKDAPSGTALHLGHAIAKSRGLNFDEVAKFDRTGNDNLTRNPDEIGFAVVRGGDIVGKHTVMFIKDGEELSLTSQISNRKSFASGALSAARYLSHKSPGFYSMEDVLGISELKA